MSTFEYVSVFVSIVVGLSVAHLLTGLVRMFGDEESKPYWLHVVWCGMVLYTLTGFWWFSLDWRSQQVWTQPLFFFLVGFAMLTYVLAAIAMPGDPAVGMDYKAYFCRIRARLFGLWALWSAVNAIDGVLKGAERQPIGLGIEFWSVQGLFVAGFLVAACTPNERFQKAWAAFNVVWIPYDIFRVSDIFGA